MIARLRGLSRKSIVRLSSILVLFVLYPLSAKSFSGEDFIYGNPWHHEDITEKACRALSFNESALDDIAWHSDYVDSYLYNPLWWIPGGIGRFKVSLASFDNLARVHFDDNFSAPAVQRTWRRYVSGTMAGLVWAAQRNDVYAARNILGISCHALEDFYSHSNWIDAPERRTKTWFDYSKVDREKFAIYIGAYEHGQQLGVKHHGKVTPACSLLNAGPVKALLTPGCSAFSPLHNAAVCDMFDECQKGKSISPSMLGITIPNNMLYVAPPGINLDARWVSSIGVKVRGLTDITGPQAFDTAKDLAIKGIQQWLGIVESKMNALGFGTFWNRVKNDASATQPQREQQFENFGKFPYQFISAGTYPPNLSTPELEYYLRCNVKTADVLNAGTDANIWLEAGGKRFLLDYMSQANPIIAYNDHERGDNIVYTVGPFTSLPSSITFYNDSANFGDIMKAIGDKFVAAVTGLIAGIGDFLLGLVGGHADKVGGAKKVFMPAELAAITSTPTNFSLEVNGGSEGKYRTDCSIKKTAQGTDWHEFEVTLKNLHCIKESEVDRLSSEDEPYVLSLLVPLPGTVQKKLVGPFSEVDTGNNRAINHTFGRVRLNKDYGMLSIPIAQWESDDESASSRNAQLNEFARQAETKTEPAEGLIATIGASLAADWRLGGLEVYAFTRGGTLRAGTVLNRSINEWIEGDRRKTYSLNAAGLQTFAQVNAATLDTLGGIRLATPGIRIPPPTIKPPPPIALW